MAGFKTSRVNSARGPLPKKMILGFIVAPKFMVVFNFGVVVDGIELAFIVHLKEGLRVVLDVVDEKNAVEMVDFVEESARERAFGFNADGRAVF